MQHLMLLTEVVHISAKYLQSIAKEQRNSLVLDCLSDAIDRTLGEDMSPLVFKTLRAVYHVDIESLQSNLVVFDKLMRRIFGNYEISV